MAKRFTDTGKWKRPWWRALNVHAKVVWGYLCDECDHAGIWIADFELLSFQVGFKVDEAKMREWLGDKVVRIDDDRFFIPSFFEFQYGTGDKSFKARDSALKRLREFGLANEHGLIKDFPKTSLTLTEESPDSYGNGNGKSNGNGKEGCGEKTQPLVTDADLESAYKAFPLKKGKTKGLEKLQSEIKTPEDLADLHRAIEIYAKEVAGRPPDKIKHFSSFVNMPWRDCLDPDYGKSDAPAPEGGLGMDWEQTAAVVLNAIVNAGTGTGSFAEREEVLGPELHKIAVKAGIQKIRDVQRGSFQLKTIAGMLKNASDLLNGGGAHADVQSVW